MRSRRAIWRRPVTTHNPLHDDFLLELPRGRDADDLAHAEGHRAAGREGRDAERSKNFFALGLVSWLYSRPTEPTLEWIESRFKDLVKESNLAAFTAGYNFGETSELFDHPYRGEAGTAAARRVHQHQRQRRAGVGPGGRRAAGQAAACSSAATRSRRPATSSTSCRSTSTSACARCRPRTRSPPSAWRSVRRSPVTSASPPPAARAWR